MSERVFVYFNLHRKCWSIKALTGADKGRVIGHEDFVVLGNAVPRVSEAGRQRVLREKRKNVHAGVVGDWLRDRAERNAACESIDTEAAPQFVTYNPYKHAGFVYAEGGEAWEGAGIVLMYAQAAQKVLAIPTEGGE